MAMKTNLKSWTVVSVLLVGIQYAIASGAVIYVDASATGANNGTSYKVHVFADDGQAPSDMVLISGGSFQMGDSKGDGDSRELPVHTVTLDSFYMGKYEVTNGQYCAYLNSALGSSIYVSSGVVKGNGNNQPYCDTHSYDSRSQIDYTGGLFSVRTKAGRDMSNDPMVLVSWYGGVAYCNWRSQQEGKEQCYNLSTWECDFSKHGYRLPTEAEWEYAERGGLSGKRFPWGDTISHSQANYHSYWLGGSPYYPYDVSPTSGFHPNWNDGIKPYTSPVGSFSANGFGVYDMTGNVREWCNDWYSSTYYSSSPPNNPTGPTSGWARVLRGGGYHHSAYCCRVPWRFSTNPNGRIHDYGFRLSLKSPFAVYLTATNNWDGKTTSLSWSSGAGIVKIYRKKESGPFEYITTISSSSYIDTVPEPGKNYTYVLKNASGVAISNEAIEKAEVVIVLVRGESYTKSGSINLNYWKPEGHHQLVDVKQWFEDNAVTCWVSPQSEVLGQGLSGWKDIYTNADELKDFICTNRIGQYQNAKINLIGHSMGGLVARKYAHDNPGVVDRIFCIHSPHTGTLFAELGAAFTSNPAMDQLTPSFLNDTFNPRHPTLDETTLYSASSTTCWEVYHSLGLLANSLVLSADPRFNPVGGVIEDPDELFGDGLIPALSARGKIYDVVIIPDIPPHIIQKKQIKVPIEENKLTSTGLDHYSCHRHPDTLEKIMDWMGLPYTQGSGWSMGMDLALGGDGEPNIVPQYYVAGFAGEFDNTADVNKVLSIGNSDSAYFRAITSDPNCSFTLSDPCRTVYDPCYADSEPNVTYEAEDEIFLYEVNSPIPGTWTLNLSTTIAPPNSVDYGLTVFESENIVLSSYSNASWVNSDANILVVAALTENDDPLIDANVIAHIILPDVNSWSLTLYDDGVHNDANANDGIYANSFTSTNNIGTYNGQVTATGLSSLGTDFERTSSLSFTVSSPDVNFAGDINDVGVDLNANGLYDILRFTIPVDVCEPNEYLLTGSLSDSNDNLIKLLSTGLLALPAGANTLTLEVTAADIVTHDVNGPYVLSDIIISDANTGLTIAAANDYNTAAYVVADFEPLDTDGDGLSDNFELSIGTNINLPDSDYDGITDYNEVGYDGDANSYNPVTDLNSINPDTDGDGMSDGWELYWNFDPLNDDGAKDNDDDSDGLTNLQEYQNNTKPDSNDTDIDGMPDGWEVSNNLNPVFFTDCSFDGDSDSLVNLLEYRNGTDPNDPDTDDDTVQDGPDNCKLMYNPDQVDTDGDGEGDTCEADISGNNEVDFVDFALLASHWRDSGCGDCGGADLDGEEDVDFADLDILADNWLAGK